ncbi:acyl-CoA-binding protein [Nostocoides sp.]|jgi:diazepam-binding inhibitor (GABA receptor modulating acyl-CoA-binding protein)|uniref:acyl-CoA-binding protein n=1 Tax=Nostocoides sp. TaxID=1917966 RepID=UPI002BD0F858|nr:acyl-CoA-binding protein [Tetrasphaera sp.]
MATEADFEAAIAAVGDLTRDPGNDTKLRLYALYKQATDGDVAGKRPGFTDFVGRAKYDAWSKLHGTNAQDARAEYVAVVHELIAAESP